MPKRIYAMVYFTPVEDKGQEKSLLDIVDKEAKIMDISRSKLVSLACVDFIKKQRALRKALREEKK